MTTREFRPLRRLLAATAAGALLALSGCVAYPGYGYPGYGYAGAPVAVVAPPIVVGVGVGCCRYGYGWGHGGYWR